MKAIHNIKNEYNTIDDLRADLNHNLFEDYVELQEAINNYFKNAVGSTEGLRSNRANKEFQVFIKEDNNTLFIQKYEAYIDSGSDIYYTAYLVEHVQ